MAHEVATMPADAVCRAGGEVWTSVKVIRRLAWQEAGELEAMREVVALLSSPP